LKASFDFIIKMSHRVPRKRENHAGLEEHEDD